MYIYIYFKRGGHTLNVSDILDVISRSRAVQSLPIPGRLVVDLWGVLKILAAERCGSVGLTEGVDGC